MKKTFAFILVFALVLTFAACGSRTPAESDPSEAPAQIPNPIREVNSSVDFIALGVYIDAPVGAEKISYSVINEEIAQVVFTVDGHEYTLRASTVQTGFDGLYGEVTNTEPLPDGAVIETVDVGSDALRLVVDEEGAEFSLVNTDGASAEAFVAVYDSVK